MQENKQIEPRIYRKTQAAIQMVETGVNPADALKITNNTSEVTGEAVRKFNKKFARYSLTHPKIVKLAHNQLERILKGEPREVKQQTVNKQGEVVDYIEQIAPTDTNILTGVGMVYDRIDPVKREDAGNINIDMLSMVLLAVRHPEGKVEGNELKPQTIDVKSTSNISP
jgi:hypothetical protein